MQSVNSWALNFDFDSFRENLKSRLDEKVTEAEDELIHKIDT